MYTLQIKLIASRLYKKIGRKIRNIKNNQNNKKTYIFFSEPIFLTKTDHLLLLVKTFGDIEPKR